jgi:transcriptional regulator with XRE-family HTH domain
VEESYEHQVQQQLALKLRMVREARGLSQEELAFKAGIDRTHVGNIENSRNSPSLSVLSRLSQALSIDVPELFEAVTPTTPLGRLNALLPYIRQYQRLADEYGIADVFQDNGGKLLQTLIITGLRNLPGREGNDAIDERGNEYELKTVNRNLTSSFSTHHHINPTIIAKYRSVRWLFCVYAGIEIVEMYQVEAARLEPYFTAWEAKWEKSKIDSMDGRGRDINNPKIPLKFVQQVGKRIYKDAEDGRVAAGPVLAYFSDEAPT